MGEARNLCREEKRELKVLASDFQLLHLAEVQKLLKHVRVMRKGIQNS